MYKRQILKLSGNLVPFPVDWDANGTNELLVTNDGKVAVYALIDGQYQMIEEFSERRNKFFAAFPIALDGNGKQLLAGQVDGELVYLSGKGSEPVASFNPAVKAKVVELGEQLSESAPELLPQFTTISSLVDTEDYAGAALAAETLANQLSDGIAQSSALELAELCRW